MSDPHNLERFITAQERCYSNVVSELRAGRKTTHWMWFIFPQLRGLGSSTTSRQFGIASADEAFAYWSHPLLGTRLGECIDLVLAIEDRTARDIFGRPDDLKLRSSLTLFDFVLPEQGSFHAALDKYFAGEVDAKTLALLR